MTLSPFGFSTLSVTRILSPSLRIVALYNYPPVQYIFLLRARVLVPIENTL